VREPLIFRRAVSLMSFVTDLGTISVVWPIASGIRKSSGDAVHAAFYALYARTASIITAPLAHKMWVS